MTSARQRRRKLREDKRIMTQMRFDLRSPCSDCPFRTDAPMHEGIISDLVSKFDSFDHDELAHSCHQTDPRACCPPEKRMPAGSPIQHCAGALIFAYKQDRPQWPMILAEAKKLLDPKKLNMAAPVFDNKVKMLLHYIPGITAKFPNDPRTKQLQAVEAQIREKL